MRTRQLLLVILFYGAGVTPIQVQEQLDNTPSTTISCDNSTLRDVRSEDDLLGELLPRVISPYDDDSRIRIKEIFMQYLVKSRTFLDMIHCTYPLAPQARLLQEDESGEDGGGGGGGGGAGGAAGGAGAAAGALDNTNVLTGVRRILANVFTGNLIGVIQEGVALRGPEPVTEVFTDVLSTLFGSTATAGITGVLGNITTTGRPQPENATLSYQEQQLLIQQHQLLLAQQQGQLGVIPGQGPIGGVPGALGGVPGQLGGGTGVGVQAFPGEHSNQHYPQFQAQTQSFPEVVQQQQLASAVQPQQGNRRRRPGQQLQEQVFQQQQQQIPVKPAATIPQQPQFPQPPQQLAGGLNRQHQLLQGGALQQGPQFIPGLQGVPSQTTGGFQGGVVGGLNRQVIGQGLGSRRRRTTTPAQEEDDEDNDEE